MAGSPTAMARPGSVTSPTPSPGKNTTSPVLLSDKVQPISAPCVTSGSSPASLMVEQKAWVAVKVHSFRIKVTSSPPGSAMATCDTASWRSSTHSAALVQAVAQAPVV